MTAPARHDRLPLPALIGVLLGAAIMVAPLIWTLPVIGLVQRTIAAVWQKTLPTGMSYLLTPILFAQPGTGMALAVFAHAGCVPSSHANQEGTCTRVGFESGPPEAQVLPPMLRASTGARSVAPPRGTMLLKIVL